MNGRKTHGILFFIFAFPHRYREFVILRLCSYRDYIFIGPSVRYFQCITIIRCYTVHSYAKYTAVPKRIQNIKIYQLKSLYNTVLIS